MTKLTVLYLNNNNISVIEHGAFQKLSYLQTLDLQDNKITGVPNMISLTSLRHLYAGGNPLQLFDLRRIGNHPWISHIYLHQSGINCMLSLPKLPRLKRIQCRKNDIEALRESIFEGFRSIKMVIFSHNKLTKLPYLGSGTGVITKLLLNGNRFYHVPDLRNFTRLKIIDLSGNYISVVPKAPLEHAAAALINLTSNPVVCVRELCWLRERVWPFTLLIVCEKGSSWQEMSPEILCYGRSF